jgi:hypothetical protein
MLDCPARNAEAKLHFWSGGSLVGDYRRVRARYRAFAAAPTAKPINALACGATTGGAPRLARAVCRPARLSAGRIARVAHQSLLSGWPRPLRATPWCRPAVHEPLSTPPVAAPARRRPPRCPRARIPGCILFTYPDHLACVARGPPRHRTACDPSPDGPRTDPETAGSGGDREPLTVTRTVPGLFIIHPPDAPGDGRGRQHGPPRGHTARAVPHARFHFHSRHIAIFSQERVRME